MKETVSEDWLDMDAVHNAPANSVMASGGLVSRLHKGDN